MEEHEQKCIRINGKTEMTHNFCVVSIRCIYEFFRLWAVRLNFGSFSFSFFQIIFGINAHLKIFIIRIWSVFIYSADYSRLRGISFCYYWYCHRAIDPHPNSFNNFPNKWNVFLEYCTEWFWMKEVTTRFTKNDKKWWLALFAFSWPFVLL